MNSLNPESHRKRSAIALLASLAITLSLVIAALLLPVPFVKLAPGPTFNVIGDVDGQEVIAISGTETYPTSGALDMTTVRESGGPRGGLTFFEAVGSWFNPDDAVVPRELIYPDDITGEEVRQRNAALFSTSESDAIAAAMNYLKLPLTTEIVVTAVVSDAPADGVFEARDEILTVDGQEVKSPSDVVDAIRGAAVGTEQDARTAGDRPDPPGGHLPQHRGPELGPCQQRRWPRWQSAGAAGPDRGHCDRRQGR